MENRERYFAEQYALHTQRHLFVTGRAGTGKTTLLRQIIKNTDKNTMVVAPTGVAAINAGGVTIHSLFQLPATAFVPDNRVVDPVKITNKITLARFQRLSKEKIKLLKSLELLIIDEISMVRADLLDAIDITLRRVRKNEAVFGGVQLIVIGDLFQLAPVVNEDVWHILSGYYDSPYFFDAHAWKRSTNLMIELQKVYRQNDEAFISILNNIRDGKSLDKDLEVLNRRVQSNLIEDTITLTTHNAQASGINMRRLSQLQTEPFTLNAEVNGDFSENAYPTSEAIVLKEGAQVMFIKNHSSGLYYNGKLGTVKGIDNDKLKVTIDDGNKTISVDREEWKSVKYSIDEETREIKTHELGSFAQFPVRLAWAVTIHKSQGLSFEKLNLDIEKTFAPGQLYVALSRCTQLDGLNLVSPIKNNHVIVDQKITNYYTQNAGGDLDETELDFFKQKYSYKKIVDRFQFMGLLETAEQFENYVKNLVAYPQAEALIMIKDVQKLLKINESHAHKFRAQLSQLAEANQESLFIERLNAAIRYFTDELHAKIILYINSHIDDVKQKKNVRSYLKQLITFLDEIWFAINSYYKLQYRGNDIYKGNKHLRKEELILSQQKKYEKGDSSKLTLELLNAGHTLKEIAEKRVLASSTIASHIAQLIQENEVSLDQMMESGRIFKIKKYLAGQDSKSLTDLKKSCPFEISYDELKWVLADS